VDQVCFGGWPAQFCLGSTFVVRHHAPRPQLARAGQDTPSNVLEYRIAARRPNNLPIGPTFTQLGVAARLTTALAAQGIVTPFPIQAATLPDSLAGRDVLGRGRTDSGKTYAFALPVLARLAASRLPRRPGRPRALILAPTRELATQITATMTPLPRPYPCAP
jgi:superfamily II DNA/RNA helicase